MAAPLPWQMHLVDNAISTCRCNQSYICTATYFFREKRGALPEESRSVLLYNCIWIFTLEIVFFRFGAWPCMKLLTYSFVHKVVQYICTNFHKMNDRRRVVSRYLVSTFFLLAKMQQGLPPTAPLRTNSDQQCLKIPLRSSGKHLMGVNIKSKSHLGWLSGRKKIKLQS